MPVFFRVIAFLLIVATGAPLWASPGARILSVAAFGAQPNSHQDSTPAVEAALDALQQRHLTTLVFPQGTYDFWPDHAPRRHYFISNHDPVEQRPVVFPLESQHNLIIDGQGSTFVFHGMLLPIAVTHSSAVRLRNLMMEVATPHELSSTVLATTEDHIDVRINNDGQFAIEAGHLWILGEQFRSLASASLLFDPRDGAMAWHTGDDWDTAQSRAEMLDAKTVRFYGLHQPSAKPGQVLVLWSGDRPNPAIFVSESTGVDVDNVTVHSAHGMGFLAQRSSEIRLHAFRVTRAEGRTRYSTTVADAVHFSNCKGRITVEDGLYENMLDDALNVHGSYLKVVGRPAPDTVVLRFGHPQSFGFPFADPGDRLQFVNATTLAPLASATVRGADRLDDWQIRVRLREPLSASAQQAESVMNLTWQPTLLYHHNHIRHNRARGILIGTAGGSTITDNFFDHLAGPAILMSADASFWFESAPAQDVTIQGNRFVDTNIADFGPSPIWIDPPPQTDSATAIPSVRNIRIIGNHFQIFQKPLLYASHVQNLQFSGNDVHLNTDFPEHAAPDFAVFSLRDVHCADLRNNTYSFPLQPSDMRQQGSSGIEWPDGHADQPRGPAGDPMGCSAVASR